MSNQRPSILLFGASTPSGAACLALAKAQNRDVTVLGRSRPYDCPEEAFVSCDLAAKGWPSACEENLQGVVVSFAPIWLLAPFLDLLCQIDAKSRPNIKGVVACSSSSALTKRFAANRADRKLVQRLVNAEDRVELSCNVLNIPCSIIRPTLIYGKAGGYGDRNLSQLLNMMRRLPILAHPAESGLRQPIHAKQLAAAALHQSNQPKGPSTRIFLGGDDCLPYETMLRRLQDAAIREQPGDPAGRCRLVALPSRLFHLLAAPLLPISPKTFEAVLRMQADLGPFTSVHELLGEDPIPFPMTPLALKSSRSSEGTLS